MTSQLPLAEQVAAARDAHPDGSITTVQPGDRRPDHHRWCSPCPNSARSQHTVYVDPYTGESQGQLTTWFGSTPATTWLDDLHRNLHLGDGGPALLRDRRQLAVGAGARRGRPVVASPQRHPSRRPAPAGAGPVRRQGRPPYPGLARHHRRLARRRPALPLGHRPDLVPLRRRELRRRPRRAERPHSGDLHQPRPPAPARRTAGATSTVAPAAGAAVEPAAFDRVLAVARGAGLSGPVEISPARGAGLRLDRHAGRQHLAGRKDRIAVDPATGTVTDRSDFADWPVLAKLSGLGIQAHMGILFGLVNQILLAALALGLLCVIVWGYRMWWQRRPTRADRRALARHPARPRRRARPAAAGRCCRRTGGRGDRLGAALFGVTLLAFLVIDVVVGAVSRRRRPAAAPTSPAPAGS